MQGENRRVCGEGSRERRNGGERCSEKSIVLGGWMELAGGGGLWWLAEDLGFGICGILWFLGSYLEFWGVLIGKMEGVWLIFVSRDSGWEEEEREGKRKRRTEGGREPRLNCLMVLESIRKRVFTR
ncbi:hypothetical protein D8674_002541 [Pyrus ussuriensis x Pyrus communis]|uniref:Uncharacterized protein n=1 Tax=Pyrus ussuriensis x Pyrus communis TaxID=2448454 RepID=A0A5N5FEL5_9ROSA|nr:hypothetical protein D8674_002541 [Pyrus ussuriensis x Pyrus communis]